MMKYSMPRSRAVLSQLRTNWAWLTRVASASRVAPATARLLPPLGQPTSAIRMGLPGYLARSSS